MQNDTKLFCSIYLLPRALGHEHSVWQNIFVNTKKKIIINKITAPFCKILIILHFLSLTFIVVKTAVESTTFVSFH